MSTINEKSIRVVAFSGKTKDYRMWSARFMAAAYFSANLNIDKTYGYTTTLRV